jgi:hypothetical protein
LVSDATGTESRRPEYLGRFSTTRIMRQEARGKITYQVALSER